MVEDRNVQEIYIARVETDMHGEPLRKKAFALAHQKKGAGYQSYYMGKERIIGYLEGVINSREFDPIQIKGDIPEKIRSGSYPKMKLTPVKPSTLATIVDHAVFRNDRGRITILP